MITANYQRARETAKKLLEQFSIHEPIINVFEIAERIGLKLRYFVPHDNLVEVSGFLDPRSKTIFVNSEDAPQRQIFTVAHELGHYVLQHPADAYGVLLRLATPIDKDPLEQEANCFAASLLVPEHMLKEIVKKYPSLMKDHKALAQFFGVSPVVIKYRFRCKD
ncbi:ImmA/IrrE family metallo-endopeptidase [Candidatus Peregrinibacteria bacterium]|jgi:Zn-dependent peptidase ImmA (M78 family)|nr:ImmA/IrrE family metallo-endopeptidase [Candidatus Peregrinibacteria bacterium]MBT4632204.1 ImmA/IrrE family metallo-endopeptidase [Candidatus Peregrinibacteria bacterium]MBT5516958.1 ImmA/IrrE family metallo-endopeptidase [Candidatus Peregrinibacteria bacterium]MBT5824385.1 ImmA/IrrE family metallo-endopeptidase [Candidatus Peregrinibacteria bacterium]